MPCCCSLFGAPVARRHDAPSRRPGRTCPRATSFDGPRSLIAARKGHPWRPSARAASPATRRGCVAMPATVLDAGTGEAGQAKREQGAARTSARSLAQRWIKIHRSPDGMISVQSINPELHDHKAKIREARTWFSPDEGVPSSHPREACSRFRAPAAGPGGPPERPAPPAASQPSSNARPREAAAGADLARRVPCHRRPRSRTARR
jgi:hypothetical protein